MNTSVQQRGRDAARSLPVTVPVVACLALVLMLGATLAQAGPREQARRMHDRLTGVPPTEPVLSQMASLIGNGDPIAAAELAMDNDAFYNVTLKNFATPWTNVCATQ